ncbi:MAG: tetratricopeptide repeat protein [Candidatus Xenobia bacterium]
MHAARSGAFIVDFLKRLWPRPATPKSPPPGRTSESLMAQGQLTEALAAVETEPADAVSMRLKGFCLEKLGRLDEALDSAEEAIKLEPRNLQGWVLRGQVLAGLDLPGEALACFEMALHLDPANEDARQGQVAALCVVSDEPRTRAQGWVKTGGRLVSGGHRAEALTCFMRACDADPTYVGAWANRGALLSQMGRHEDALACVQEAVRLNAEDDMAWYVKATVHAVSGDFATARTCLDTALRLNPGNTRARAYRERVIAELR